MGIEIEDAKKQRLLLFLAIAFCVLLMPDSDKVPMVRDWVAFAWIEVLILKAFSIKKS